MVDNDQLVVFTTGCLLIRLSHNLVLSGDGFCHVMLAHEYEDEYYYYYYAHLKTVSVINIKTRTELKVIDKTDNFYGVSYFITPFTQKRYLRMGNKRVVTRS